MRPSERPCPSPTVLQSTRDLEAQHVLTYVVPYSMTPRPPRRSNYGQSSSD